MPGDDRLRLDDDERHALQTRDNQTHSRRSACASRSRRGRDRFSTASWCRNASSSSGRTARERAQCRRVSRNERNTAMIVEKRMSWSPQHQPFQQERPFQQAQRRGDTQALPTLGCPAWLQATDLTARTCCCGRPPDECRLAGWLFTIQVKPLSAGDEGTVRARHRRPSLTVPFSDCRKAASACLSAVVSRNGRSSGSRPGLRLPPRL